MNSIFSILKVDFGYKTFLNKPAYPSMVKFIIMMPKNVNNIKLF